MTQPPWRPLGIPSPSPIHPLTTPPTLTLLTLLTLLTTISLLFLAIYRLYLSPLAPFPGPTHAALTPLVEFHDNVLRSGRFVWRLRAWHARYGPIVRISPTELHVADPAFHAALYVSGRVRRTHKCAWHAKLFGSTRTTVGAVGHEVHRARREPLAAFLARRNVVGGPLEEVVWRGVGRLGEVLRGRAENSGAVNLSAALAACSADIVGACALGEGFGLLEREDMGEEWWRLMLDLSRNTHLMKHVGFVYTLFTWLPQRLVALVHPLTKQLFDVQNSIDARIREAKASLSSASPSPSSSSADKTIPVCPAPVVEEETTLLRCLLTAHPTLHSGAALPDELFTLLGAGTLSTSHALSVLLYHVHAHPPYLSRLRAELLPLYTSPCPHPSLSSLQALPFLTACITEALRLSHGVAGRLPRVAPDDDLAYTDPASGRAWRVPRGTAVSMTHMFMHLDERLFAAPMEFVPERWMGGGGLGQEEAVAQMKRHFAPFGRGSRACVGRDLAVAVMAAVVGEVVGALWVVHLQLFHTPRAEVEVARDWFGGVPAAGLRCRGVRMRVLRRRGGNGEVVE
ncbi:cytochrome P450 [Phyllosticta citribraziliensis]|uniref:Cytochrome P450 n=1 Tax=Phyllosticta citribraziliensis TaxID=989973 RepID=A0ABR1L4W3_9PEZI